MKRYLKDLTVPERVEIAKNRLLEPELSLIEFSNKYNITLSTLKSIEGRLNFNAKTAENSLMTRILEKDNALIELSTDIKNKWAESISKKKTIQNKDIETLDKIENTALKRAAILKASEDAKEKNEPMNITITL